MLAVQADRRFPEDNFFLDTRDIQEPTVKGGGLPPGAFYGANSASNSGRPQARGSSAEEELDRPGPSRRPRPPPCGQRKQLQQVGRYALHISSIEPTSCHAPMHMSNLTGHVQMPIS